MPTGIWEAGLRGESKWGASILAVVETKGWGHSISYQKTGAVQSSSGTGSPPQAR